jgi:hypothetical protein
MWRTTDGGLLRGASLSASSRCAVPGEGRDQRDGAGFDPAPRSDLGKPYPIIRSVFALTEVFGPLDVVMERASRTLRGGCHIVEHEDNEMMRPLRDRPDPITDP